MGTDQTLRESQKETTGGEMNGRKGVGARMKKDYPNFTSSSRSRKGYEERRGERPAVRRVENFYCGNENAYRFKRGKPSLPHWVVYATLRDEKKIWGANQKKGNKDSPKEGDPEGEGTTSSTPNREEIRAVALRVHRSPRT